MRLYADENFSLAVTIALRALVGHDVLTALEDGRAAYGDYGPLIRRTGRHTKTGITIGC